MKILIIGGTKFVGRHLIRAAAARNHEVTIFHRGKQPLVDRFDVEEILGDRNDDLAKLKNQKWDAVIDTCGYLPDHVRASAEALHPTTDKYVYISSISAYAGFAVPDFDETAPLAMLTDEQEAALAEIDLKGDINAYKLGESYGALKALCEKAVIDLFGENGLIIRPGLIVGEFDWTDRFTYWVMRVAAGGEVLAPGNTEASVQFIDARDISEWIIRMIEGNESGIYNATGKPSELSFGAMLETIKTVSNSSAEFVWMSDGFMHENEVAPWTDMPVYLPETPDTKGFSAANIDRAIKKNLVFRPLEDTVSETLKWRRQSDAPMCAGLTPERESCLLEKLRKS